MLALIHNNSTQTWDMAMSGSALLDDPTLETVVAISLFTHRLALPDDALPDPKSADRRGWWADTYSDYANDNIGSRLWLLSRAKATVDIPQAAKGYALEALQWMVADGVASAVDCNCYLQTQAGTSGLLLALQPIITRPNNPTPWSKVWLKTMAALGG